MSDIRATSRAASDLSEIWQGAFGVPSPSKILAVGLNYWDHLEEARKLYPTIERPSQPSFFAKLPNTLRSDGDDLILPEESQHVDAEAELAIVIGRTGRRIAVAEAIEYIEGYTVANDVSARDIQFKERHIDRSKNFDSFCPILPGFVSASRFGMPDDLRIAQRVNDEVVQDGSTSQFIFSVAEIVSFVSQSMTLTPGDILLTGTPSGVGVFREPKRALRPGDVVEIEIEGIGVLTNTACRG